MRRIEIGNVEDRDIIISKNHSQPFSIVLTKTKTKPKSAITGQKLLSMRKKEKI